MVGLPFGRRSGPADSAWRCADAASASNHSDEIDAATATRVRWDRTRHAVCVCTRPTTSRRVMTREMDRDSIDSWSH